jgi:hypothetical protein
VHVLESNISRISRNAKIIGSIKLICIHVLCARLAPAASTKKEGGLRKAITAGWMAQAGTEAKPTENARSQENKEFRWINWSDR